MNPKEEEEVEKRDVTIFATHCRLKIQLFLHVYAHITQKWFVHPFFAYLWVCTDPLKCSFVYKTPPRIKSVSILDLHAMHACMHPNNDRPISHEFMPKTIKYKRIKVANVYIFFFFLCMSRLLSSTSLLLWYIQRKDRDKSVNEDEMAKTAVGPPDTLPFIFFFSFSFIFCAVLVGSCAVAKSEKRTFMYIKYVICTTQTHA